MSTYLLIDLLVILFPLILSFDKKVAYFQHWPEVFLAMIPVGVLFILWDSIVTKRGHWSFNPEKVGKIRIFSLPLEEILFFVTVPYSCLFLYEVFKAYFPMSAWNIPIWPFFVLGAVFFILALLFRKKAYTFLAFFAAALFFVLTASVFPALFRDPNFWMYLGMSYVAFLLVNGFLTGIPVVRYSDEATTTKRVLTIPIEDFFYNFALLGLYALCYRLIQTWTA